MTISFIIPSIGRGTLTRTLGSINKWLGDEILIEYDIPPSRMWGNPQRNKGIKKATCDYLAFIDDDDYYVEGHRFMMEEAINENPDKPILFQQQYPDGHIIWNEKKVIPGNISSNMILVPNKPEMFSPWKDGRNMADFIFVNTWKWKEIAWIEKVLVLTGNNDGGAKHHV